MYMEASWNMGVLIFIGMMCVVIGAWLWSAKCKKQAIVAVGIGIVCFILAISISPSNEGGASNDGVYHYQDKDGNWNEIDMNDYHQDGNGNWHYQK